MTKERIIESIQCYGQLCAAGLKQQPWWYREITKNAVKATLAGVERFLELHLTLSQVSVDKMELPAERFCHDIGDIWDMVVDRPPTRDMKEMYQKGIDFLAERRTK